MMAGLKFLWRWLIVAPLCILIVFGPLMLANMVQMLTILIRPISLKLFRRINTSFAALS